MASMHAVDQQRARELPAPRTIAPSREDVLSNLAFFFGDPVVPERLRDYSEHNAMTFHFPGEFASLAKPSPLDQPQCQCSLTPFAQRRRLLRSEHVSALVSNSAQPPHIAHKIRVAMKTSEHRREIVRKSREKNKHKYVDKKKESDKKYYETNKKTVRETQTVYRNNNKERVNKQSQAINKARLKSDPGYALTCLMRTRIGNHLRGKSAKHGKTFELIGCSKEHLKRHLGNKSGQIDHIFPLTVYNSTTEQHKMTRWENLQMLSAEENNEKNNNLPTKDMASKVPRHLWPDGITETMLPDIYKNWATSLSKT